MQPSISICDIAAQFEIPSCGNSVCTILMQVREIMNGNRTGLDLIETALEELESNYNWHRYELVIKSLGVDDSLGGDISLKDRVTQTVDARDKLSQIYIAAGCTIKQLRRTYDSLKRSYEEQTECFELLHHLKEGVLYFRELNRLFKDVVGPGFRRRELAHASPELLSAYSLSY